MRHRPLLPNAIVVGDTLNNLTSGTREIAEEAREEAEETLNFDPTLGAYNARNLRIANAAAGTGAGTDAIRLADITDAVTAIESGEVTPEDLEDAVEAADAALVDIANLGSTVSDDAALTGPALAAAIAARDDLQATLDSSAMSAEDIIGELDNYLGDTVWRDDAEPSAGPAGSYTFTEDGTWENPWDDGATNKYTIAIVECWGGGGAGGSGGASRSAGGGGGGGYSRKMFYLEDLDAEIDIVVGAGGTPITASGNTSFGGTLLVAYGGGRGGIQQGGGGGGPHGRGADGADSGTTLPARATGNGTAHGHEGQGGMLGGLNYDSLPGFGPVDGDAHGYTSLYWRPHDGVFVGGGGGCSGSFSSPGGHSARGGGGGGAMGVPAGSTIRIYQGGAMGNATAPAGGYPRGAGGASSTGGAGGQGASNYAASNAEAGQAPGGGGGGGPTGAHGARGAVVITLL